MMTYYYEYTERGVCLMAYGGDWTGAQIIQFWPRSS